MLTSPGRTEEHHVIAGGDEVQGAQMGDGVAFESAGVVEVELLQRFTRREASGADTFLTAVRLPGRHLALQAGHQIFLVAPVLGAGPLSEAGRRIPQRGCFESPCQIGNLGRRITGWGGGFGGRHQATPPPSRSTPSAVS